MFLTQLFGGSSSSKSASSVPAMIDRLESRSLMSVVLPGNFVPVGGTKVAVRPELAGTVIHDSLIPITIDNSAGVVIFKGHLQDRVIRETRTGTLDFYQDIRADAGFKTSVFLQDVERTSFANYSTDVDYRTDGLGTPTDHPVLATRTVGTGPMVSFFFNNAELSVGHSTLFYFVKTNAKTYDLKGLTSIEVKSPMEVTGAPGTFGTVRIATVEPTAIG